MPSAERTTADGVLNPAAFRNDSREERSISAGASIVSCHARRTSSWFTATDASRYTMKLPFPSLPASLPATVLPPVASSLGLAFSNALAFHETSKHYRIGELGGSPNPD